MRLSTKHAGESNVVRSDFTGGLNLSTVPEMIGDNQLAEATNMECDRATGALKTCCGTALWFKMPFGTQITALLYDRINHCYLVVCGRKVYKSFLVDTLGTMPSDRQLLGELTGEQQPIGANWEDGLLIASGGKLQYFDGQKLFLLEDSPEVCSGVYVRAGCVLVYYGNTIRYSAVGNEADWSEDNNIDSASKFVEAGYKDGGNIIGLVNLSSDVLILKDNGRLYRLYGEFPDWAIKEVSRNISCLNQLSFCSVTNSVLILGQNTLQVITPTQNYGDMQAENIAKNIVNLFYQLDHNARVYFIAPFNQVWIIGSLDRVVVYDITFNAFFVRKFTSPVNDICVSENDVLLVRDNAVTQIFSGTYDDYAFSDQPAKMQWSFQAKRLTATHSALLKRSSASYIPLTSGGESLVSCGEVVVPLASAKTLNPIDNTPLGSDTRILFPISNQKEMRRQVYRSGILDVSGQGSGSGIILNQIEMAVVEV